MAEEGRRTAPTAGQLADWYGAQFYQYLQQVAANGVLAPRGPAVRIDVVHAQPLPQGAESTS